MNCEQLQPELVGYHFGVIQGELRGELEAHLLACPTCLRDYLDIKRSIETAEIGPLPSKAVRERLRASAARELRFGGTPAWSWRERTLPVGFGALMMCTILVVVNILTSRAGEAPRGLVDAPRGLDSKASERFGEPPDE